MKCWKAIVSYKPDFMNDEEFYIEEIEELHNLIELGPDWNLIDAIVITLSVQS